MGSLIKGDTTRIESIFKKVKRFGPIVSILAYIAGIVYFCLLAHEELIHGTYISENALMPGLVTSDVHSSEVITTYHELLKSHYELKNNEFDMKFIHDLFQNHAKIEAYIQHFNVSNPFYDSEPNTEHLKAGRNVYAFARSQRADGTESIVVSAPVYVSNNNKRVPNFLGIAQLFVLADLAKNQPYWAKDMIFVVTEQSNYGMQAWVNSYYDIQSNYIKAENLKKRGGSIQAAINLEFPEIYIHKLELKIEGANGKLPNLDLFNSIIVICSNQQFECTLESEKGNVNPEFNYYNKRNKAPIEMFEGVKNLLNMVFKQASGVPSSLHGYFLNHRIEALTISGAKNKLTGSKKQNHKQNLLKATRIIEGSLRSVNNLLERFHQSFFFYLLPSSQHYVSIGNYMPVFGLIALPILIEIITIWFSVFLRNTTATDTSEQKKPKSNSVIFEVFGVMLPNILIPAAFGFLLYFSSPYFIFFGKKLGLAPKESIIACYIQVLIGILFAPILINTKSAVRQKETGREEFVDDTGKKLTNLVVLLALVLFLGTLSLLNFSLALLLAVFYVPVSLFSIREISNKFAKFVQLLVIILATPMVYFCVLYLLYSSLNGVKIEVFGNYVEFYQTLSEKFYRFMFLSKICNIWTQDLVHLCLIPIWSALWFIAFPRWN